MKKRKTTQLVAKPNLRLEPTGGGALVQVVLNADLRCGHDGLLELGKKAGVDWARVQPGQYVAFVNNKLNRFMLLGVSPSRRGAIIIYYRSYSGRVDRNEMETLPQAFGMNKRITSSSSVQARLDDEFAFKRIRRVGPVPIKRGP